MAHFERDLLEYRKRLGKDIEHVEFLGVTVPEARVEAMPPIEASAPGSIGKNTP